VHLSLRHTADVVRGRVGGLEEGEGAVARTENAGRAKHLLGEEEQHALEHLVARHAGDGHVEEEPVEHRARDVVQRLGQQHQARQQDERVRHQRRQARLAHVRDAAAGFGVAATSCSLDARATHTSCTWPCATRSSTSASARRCSGECGSAAYIHGRP